MNNKYHEFKDEKYFDINSLKKEFSDIIDKKFIDLKNRIKEDKEIDNEHSKHLKNTENNTQEYDIDNKIVTDEFNLFSFKEPVYFDIHMLSSIILSLLTPYIFFIPCIFCDFKKRYCKMFIHIFFSMTSFILIVPSILVNFSIIVITAKLCLKLTTIDINEENNIELSNYIKIMIISIIFILVCLRINNIFNTLYYCFNHIDESFIFFWIMGLCFLPQITQIVIVFYLEYSFFGKILNEEKILLLMVNFIIFISLLSIDTILYKFLKLVKFDWIIYFIYDILKKGNHLTGTSEKELIIMLKYDEKIVDYSKNTSRKIFYTLQKIILILINIILLFLNIYD